MMSVIRLGRVVATPGVQAVLTDTERHHDLRVLLLRHQAGDWGDVPDDDRLANDQAVLDGDRVLSAYRLAGTRVWIITEADRAVTTVLQPDEY